MRHSAKPASGNATRFTYEWRLNREWNELSATVCNHFEDIQPGSPEEFIFEHYWGYNTWTDAVTMEYQVEHVRWQVAEVRDPVFKADIAALYGEEFVPFLSKRPYSAFFAKGSEIIVRKGTKITACLTLPVSPAP
jgi:hypothetical protein